MIIQEPSSAKLWSWEVPPYEVWLYTNLTTAPPEIDYPEVQGRFTPYLYNQTGHVLTQAQVPVYSFFLAEKTTGLLLALLHMTLDEEGRAWSLPQAPFGGIQYATHTPPEALAFMLDCVDQWAQTHKISALTVKTAPTAYQPLQHEVLHQLYLEAGYKVADQFVNHHIPVSERTFTELLSAAERKRLRKCRRAGFISRRWHQPDPEAVYNFLENSRRRQGYPLSIGYEQLLNLLTRFPQEALVFGVSDGDIIASLTVAIRVSPEVLYNFLPADNLDYRTYSPTVLLNEALYRYSQSEGIRVLDLGISLDHNGQPKPSLVRFKENIGGIASEKITYSKVYQ